MPRTFTLAQLRTAVRQRADVENDPHKTDAEINGLISSSYTWLYDILVQSGLHFFESQKTYVTTGAEAYPLPNDFMAVIGVRYKLSDEAWSALREVSPHDQARFTRTGSRAHCYRPVNNNLELYPTPPSGQTYRLWYIPAPAVLDEDTDTIDGVSGWEELVIVDAAIKCLRKEDDQGAAAALAQDRAMLMARVNTMSQNRAIASATSIFLEDVAYEPDPASWRQEWGR